MSSYILNSLKMCFIRSFTNKNNFNIFKLKSLVVLNVAKDMFTAYNTEQYYVFAMYSIKSNSQHHTGLRSVESSLMYCNNTGTFYTIYNACMIL